MLKEKLQRMSMLYMIITIAVMVCIQFIIGFLWYSKFLFGKLFMSLSNIDFTKIDNKSLNASYAKALISAILKAVIIYTMAGGMLILQNMPSFIFVLLIAFLVIFESFDDHIWSGKSFKLYLLNACQTFITIIACFLIAFLSYSMFFSYALFP
ncbi:MAG: DUF1761 domain-containing protein [Alphaproteobacteria bacterium]|nr:DUF1761 domain-containing protein [Alphaproteobacteria bacterium]